MSGSDPPGPRALSLSQGLRGGPAGSLGPGVGRSAASGAQRAGRHSRRPDRPRTQPPPISPLGEIENLYKRKLLRHVLTFADFTRRDEADIEDMFDGGLLELGPEASGRGNHTGGAGADGAAAKAAASDEWPSKGSVRVGSLVLAGEDGATTPGRSGIVRGYAHLYAHPDAG